MTTLIHRTIPCVGLALTLTVAAGWGARARADEPLPPKDPAACCAPVICDPPPDGCPCPDLCLPKVLFHVPCFDKCIADFQAARDASCFKLGAGAYHWVNIQNQGGDVTYGYPNGGEGTYFYYLNADISCKGCSPCGPTFGAHAQLRMRDDTVFRSFFDEKVWFYEAYASMELPRWGTFKAGKVWKRFGADWDGTFWGNVPYYDGMKLDPDFGVSWEQTWNKGDRWELDTFAQFFFRDDKVNGSISGADAESDPDREEQNTFVVRVVPRYRFTKNMALSLGLSGLFGQVAGTSPGVSDETLTQFAADVEFTWCGLKAFAEYAHSDGIQNSSHYVTGGPSDTYDTLMVGLEYKLGAFTPRVVYSHGEYENPGGSQDLLLLGGTVQLFDWMTLYLEYVDWTVEPDGGAESVFEDGFQVVFNWNV